MVVSELLLSLRTALNLLPDIPQAGLQSYFMSSESVACEKQRALITPGKALRL